MESYCKRTVLCNWQKDDIYCGNILD